MKHIGYILLLFLTGLITISYRPSEPSTPVDFSVIVLKVKYNSYGLTGFGGKLVIRNIETNGLYESHSNKGINPYIIIEDLPRGKYLIEELNIISGPNVLTIQDKSKFNIIDINDHKIYYLGSYITKKIPPVLELNFEIHKTPNDDKEQIIKQLKKKSDNWLNQEIDFDQSLFKTDSINIRIKNYR